jgi:hypothetical protein
LRTEEWLGDCARDVDDHVLGTNGIDQTDLILHRASMALWAWDRSACGQEQADEYQQTLHNSPQLSGST